MRHRRISSLMLALTLALAASVNVHATPDPHTAFERANSFFGNRSLFAFITAPLARRQAVRKLRLLSNSLDNLMIRKQELVEALSSSSGSAVTDADGDGITKYKDAVQELRKSIQEFCSLLPEESREKGMEVATELFQGLSEKWQTLDNAERLIRSHRADSAGEATSELKTAVNQAMTLKKKVDDLIRYVETH